MRKTIYQVSNGVVSAEFTKKAVDDMKMLGLIQPRGMSVITREGKPVHVYRYTSANDNRPVKGKW